MQSWGWGNVPPVATGKFSEDAKVHQVSPVSTSGSADGSDDSKLALKDRRLALEQEVAKLRKKHTQEVNLHRALERALQRPVGVLPRIPSYLPAKIQKLLAEVAVLEEEVIRLEDHVVYLRQEISDEAKTLPSHGTQKLKPINDNNLSKPRNLSKIRVTKEPAKEPPSSKFPATVRKPIKANSEASSQQKTKDTVKEQPISKASKLPLVSAKELVPESDPVPSAADSCRRPASGGGIAAPESAPVLAPAPAPGQTSASGPPPSRKPPPANEALSRFQGLQQPWKPTGGINGKNNIFRQFNSLGWGDAKLSAMVARHAAGISSPRNSPRAGFDPASSLSVNWTDKQGVSSSPKTSGVSSPRIWQPFSGTSTVRLWEKENLQSASGKLTSKSPRASKLGLSVDLSSSNVERKSTLGSKGSSAPPPPTSRAPNMGVINEGVQGTDPNEIAEELVRCLIAIYSKLAKPNPPAGVQGSQRSGSKSTLHSSASKSKPSNGPLYDPYGICKDSQLWNIGAYLQTQEITVDTIDTKSGNWTALSKKLGLLMEQLEKTDLETLSHHEKLAFWINIYNVCMMHAFREHGIPSSPSKVVALMRKAVVNVGGYVLNALTIEHFILRLPCRPKNVRTSPWKHFQRADANPAMAFLKNVGMEEIIERSAYGLDWNEPMVTFALCCGSRSSPVLRVYTASDIEAELETAKREYLQAAVGVSNQKKLYIPKLLEWYMRDFAKDMEGLLDWLCQQLSGPLHDAVQDCINHPKEGVLSHSIEVMPYDFNFRYLFLIG